MTNHNKINVFITVDVEHSLGGAHLNPKLKPVGSNKLIWGKIGGSYYGIPLIMDIAERYGLFFTFFLEVFSSKYFGEKDVSHICQYILSRGHDVQLHLHPLFLYFIKPFSKNLMDKAVFLHYFNLEKQCSMIKDGKYILIRNGALPPIAFRAGSYGANLDTLKALKLNNFLIDSSFNRCYMGSHSKLPNLDINDVFGLEGVWELPITNFLEFPMLNGGRPKPLDINGVSFKEIKKVLENAYVIGQSNIMIIMHSFSFIQPLDIQYKRVRLRRRVILRFENLCRYLAMNTEKYKVRVLGEVGAEDLEKMGSFAKHCLFEMPASLSILRLFEQSLERLKTKVAL